MTASGLISKIRYDRLCKLNEIFLQGGYTVQGLARRFGVTDPVIINDRRYIQDKWWPKQENEKVSELRDRRVAELEHIKKLALESYQRSRQDKEELTTRYEKRTCVECKGSGSLPKWKVCPNCEGLGFINEEIITRKVEGRPGDSAFLARAASIVIELCKIQGLYAPVVEKVQHVVKGEVKHSFQVKYANVDPDLVIEAKSVMARLEEAQTGDELRD